jgi:hypothetical protein
MTDSEARKLIRNIWKTYDLKPLKSEEDLILSKAKATLGKNKKVRTKLGTLVSWYARTQLAIKLKDID